MGNRNTGTDKLVSAAFIQGIFREEQQPGFGFDRARFIAAGKSCTKNEIAGLSIVIGANWSKLKRLLRKKSKKPEADDDEENDDQQNPGA